MNDRVRAGEFLGRFAEFLGQDLPYGAAFLAAAWRSGVDPGVTLTFMSEQFDAGPASCSMLVAPLVDAELVSIVRRGERVGDVVGHLRLAAAVAGGTVASGAMAEITDPAQVRRLLDGIAAALDDGLGVSEAFTLGSTSAGFDLEAVHSHLSGRTVDGWITFAALLEGLVPDEVLAVVRRGEERADVIDHLRAAGPEAGERSVDAPSESAGNRNCGTLIRGPKDEALAAAAVIARRGPVEVFDLDCTPLDIVIEAAGRTRWRGVELVVLSNDEIPYLLMRNIATVLDVSAGDPPSSTV